MTSAAKSVEQKEASPLLLRIVKVVAAGIVAVMVLPPLVLFGFTAIYAMVRVMISRH